MESGSSDGSRPNTQKPPEGSFDDPPAQGSDSDYNPLLSGSDVGAGAKGQEPIRPRSVSLARGPKISFVAKVRAKTSTSET